MQMKMYTVYDIKVEAYLMPHFFRSRGEALRAYVTACNDSQTSFFKNPEDFLFYEIGDYDDSNATVTMLPIKFLLGTAIEFKTSLSI